MTQNQVMLTAFMLILAGCVSLPQPMAPARANAKVGVLVLIDDNPKQLYRGMTIFSRTERADASEWKFVDDIHSYVADIANGANGQVIERLEPSPVLIRKRLELLSAGWSEMKFNEDLSESVDELVSGKDLDFLLVVAPREWGLPPGSNNLENGYGVLSGCVLKTCFARGFANVTARVFTLNPTRLVSWGIVLDHPFPVYTDLGANIEHLPSSEIDKMRGDVKAYVFKDIDGALERAGLALRAREPLRFN